MKYSGLHLIMTLFLLSQCKSPTDKAELRLSDGKYEVIFLVPNTSESYELRLLGEKYEKRYKSGQIKEGKFERVSEQEFIFPDEVRTPPAPLNQLDSQVLRLGRPVMCLTRAYSDTIEFHTRFEADLHVDLNRGFLVKK